MYYEVWILPTLCPEGWVVLTYPSDLGILLDYMKFYHDDQLQARYGNKWMGMVGGSN